MPLQRHGEAPCCSTHCPPPSPSDIDGGSLPAIRTDLPSTLPRAGSPVNRSRFTSTRCIATQLPEGSRHSILLQTRERRQAAVEA